MIFIKYEFAFFSSQVLDNYYHMFFCCRNSSVESFYAKTNTSQGYYYLNNFNNIFISGGKSS